MAHRPGSGEFAQRHGENVFRSWGAERAPAEVVGSWADEVASYDYGANRCSGTCGHYTQIVWAASAQLGRAMRTGADSSEIWVCTYDPAGNYVAQPPY